MTQPDARNPLGETGHRVRRNVRLIRAVRSLSKQALSDRTAEAGRRIPPLGVSRLESGTRRVDVDDLVALATALGVKPAELLAEPACRDCAGMPPAGFTCNTCGLGAPGV